MSTQGEAKWDDTHFINDVLFRPDITSEESQEIYKQWVQADKYDSMISQPEIYNSLRVLGETIKDLFHSPQSVLALDVGAGTGLTGQVLRNAGVITIHALEPQKESAEVSRQKGIYQKIIPDFITKDKTPGIEDDTYDLIVSTGAFAPGHIPHDALIELVRIGKPGGYVAICIREEFLRIVPDYKDRLEPLMDQLASQGKWTLVKRQTYPHHFMDLDGVMFLFRIC